MTDGCYIKIAKEGNNFLIWKDFDNFTERGEICQTIAELHSALQELVEIYERDFKPGGSES
jgi:hypothetical protein